jgi:hypothetical protein
MDSLSANQSEELRSIIASKPSSDQLRIIFGPANYAAKLNAAPLIGVDSVFQRLSSDLSANRANPQRPEFSNQMKPIAQGNSGPLDVICPRCLELGHFRRNCFNKICCHNCKRQGHISHDCRFIESDSVSGLQKEGHQVSRPRNPSLGKLEYVPRVKKSQISPAIDIDLNLPLLIIEDPGCPSAAGIDDACPAPSPGISRFDIGLQSTTNPGSGCLPPSSCPFAALSAPCSAWLSLSTDPAQGRSPPMANFPVHPGPFLPGQYEILDVTGRPQHCRYHLSSPVSPKHEDVAIATIAPALDIAAPFDNIRALLQHLIVQNLGFCLQLVQRSPIGHAFVRLDSIADRDWLVDHSPHDVHGIQISFSKHDASINHRRVEYNNECWLMLLAFPLDLWATEHVKGEVKDFASLLIWDEEASSYGKIIIKVKLQDLARVPYSCVVTSPDGSESWSVPIFILSQHILNDVPDEDQPPPHGGTPHPLPEQMPQVNAPQQNAPWWQNNDLPALQGNAPVGPNN